MFQTTEDRILMKVYAMTDTPMGRSHNGWTALPLDTYARDLGITDRGVRSAIRRLEKEALAETRIIRIKSSPRLCVRLTDVGLARSGEFASVRVSSGEFGSIETKKLEKLSNLETAGRPAASPKSRKFSMSSDPEENYPTPQSPPSRLRGSVAGADARVRDAAAERHSAAPRTATELSHRWNRLLHMNGDPAFNVDKKTLRHINLCQKRMPDLPDRLDDIIDNWTTFAPKNAGPVPHPWAVLRALPNYVQHREAVAEYEQKATVNAPVEKTVAPAPPPMVTKKQPSIMDKILGKDT